MRVCIIRWYVKRICYESVYDGRVYDRGVTCIMECNSEDGNALRTIIAVCIQHRSIHFITGLGRRQRHPQSCCQI